jgi:hypothetical protein
MSLYPRLKPKVNCYQCKYYRPDDTVDFIGACIRWAPAGSGNLVTVVTAGQEFPPITDPGVIWCGEFEKWEGALRECGAPPEELLRLRQIDEKLSLLSFATKGSLMTDEAKEEMNRLVDDREKIFADIARTDAEKAEILAAVFGAGKVG